ncbi:MAG: hypothetical protein WDZ84_06920 [Rhodovibrionaceae bacterium]
MSDQGTGRHFRRVIVAFDATAQGRALLELAADLAESLGTPLSGLFVEDEALISYAASPLAFEVSLGSASLRELSSARMRAHFRVQERLARELIEKLRGRRRLQCSFQTGRGRFEGALAAVAERDDLLLISPRVGPCFDPRRLADARRAASRQALQSLLALFEPARARALPSRGRVQAVVAAEEDLAATLAVAGGLAARRGAGLAVTLLDPDLATAAERAARRAAGERVPLLSIRPGEIRSLRQELSRDLPGLIVAGPGLDEAARAALAGLGCPVLQLSA